MTDKAAVLSDETLVAYADGELQEQEATEVEQALQQDPAAGHRLRALVEAGEMARRAFAEIAEEPVPERLRAAIMNAPMASDSPASSADAEVAVGKDTPDNVVSLPRRQPRQQVVWRPVALAASLALAVAAGVFAWLPGGDNSGPGGRMTAQLAATLSQTPSYQPVQLAEGEVTVIGSFLSQDDRFCREYERLSDGGGERGLACRTSPETEWQLIASSNIAAVDTPAENGFRPAGADTEDPVAAAVGRLQAGPLLSAEEELRALQQ